MKQNPVSRSRLARASFKWLVVALVVGFAVYRMKFAPMAVVTHKLATGPVVAEVMGTGTLEARVKTTISPRIQERLAEVLVDQGDAVKGGQLLARLDDGELKMQVEVAEAARVAARASLERVKTDEARAVAVGQQARLDYKRISDLLTNQISSQADFDKAVEQVQCGGGGCEAVASGDWGGRKPVGDGGKESAVSAGAVELHADCEPV